MDVVQYYRALVLGSSTVEGGREDSPKAKCQCAMLEEVVELPLALSITPRVVWHMDAFENDQQIHWDLEL